jgi:cytochrome c oxidase subunit 2
MALHISPGLAAALRRPPALIAAIAMAAALGGCIAAATAPQDNVVHLTAKRFEYVPAVIKLKKGEPATIALTSEDVHHGFRLVEFGLRADAFPGQTTLIHFTPDKTGEFYFACDVFCGTDHEDMAAELIVTE